MLAEVEKIIEVNKDLKRELEAAKATNNRLIMTQHEADIAMNRLERELRSKFL